MERRGGGGGGIAVREQRPGTARGGWKLEVVDLLPIAKQIDGRFRGQAATCVRVAGAAAAPVLLVMLELMLMMLLVMMMLMRMMPLELIADGAAAAAAGCLNLMWRGRRRGTSVVDAAAAGEGRFSQ